MAPDEVALSWCAEARSLVGMSPAEASEDLRARVEAVARELGPRIQAALGENPPAGLKDAAQAALLHRKAGRFEAALQGFETVATLLDDAAGSSASAARAAEAQREIEAARGKDFVKLRALHIDWSNALGRARQELDRFIQRVVTHPEVIYHPSRDELMRKTRELSRELPDFDGSLERALEELALGPGSADVDTARAEALRAVDVYRKQLEGKTFLRELDDSFVGKSSVFASMVDGLRRLETVLGAQ